MLRTLLLCIGICFSCSAADFAASEQTSDREKAVFGSFSATEYAGAPEAIQRVMRESSVLLADRSVAHQLVSSGTGFNSGTELSGGVGLNSYREHMCATLSTDYGTCRVFNPNIFDDHSSEQLRGVRQNGFCKSVPFQDQPAVRGCSGFLIDSTPNGALVQTAGHCVRTQSECDRLSAIFGYYYEQEPTSGTSFSALNQIDPAEDIYRCKRIVAHRLDSRFDYSVIELDRVVHPSHQPVALPEYSDPAPKAGSVYSVGHPQGLPAKSISGTIRETDRGYPLYFEHDSSTFVGNSGGMVLTLSGGKAIAWGHNTRVFSAHFGFDKRTVGSETTYCLAYVSHDGSEHTTNHKLLPRAEYASHAATAACLGGYGSEQLCAPLLRSRQDECGKNPALAYCDPPADDSVETCGMQSRCEGDVLVQCNKETPCMLGCVSVNDVSRCRKPAKIPDAVRCEAQSREWMPTCLGSPI